MKQAKPLIHIGYHKTASTWLQDNLFDNPESGFERYFSQQDVRDHIVLPGSFKFSTEKLKELYEKTLEEKQASEDKVSVLSNERLSGNPHSGGYDSKEIADRLYESFPEGKVLIVVREQLSAITSSYVQYVRAGGPCSINDYLEPPNRGKPVIPLFDFEHFNYLRLVKYYVELFGKENVLVLPYELFREDAQEFCNRICDFAGAKRLASLPFTQRTNRRISTLSSVLLRQSNKLFAKTRLNPSAIDLKTPFRFLTGKEGRGASQDRANNNSTNQEHKIQTGDSYRKILFLDSLMPSFLHELFDKRLKEIIKRKIANRYSSGNTELNDLMNGELEKYGYLARQKAMA